MRGWHRGNGIEWHQDHPDRPPLKQVPRTATDNAGGGLYTLYRLRWDSGTERICAMLSGLYTGSSGTSHPHKGDGRAHPPYTAATQLLDLLTGEEFDISSQDRDVEAKRISVRDLPPALRDAWPRDKKGKPVRPGLDDSGSGLQVGSGELRELARAAGSPATPSQRSLFEAMS